MKKVYKYLSVLTLLVTLSSCGSNNSSSSSSTSSSSVSPSSSSSAQTAIKPKYELEEETNILPYNNGDTITNDLSRSMDLYNIVSKSLKNSNHKSSSWVYLLNADFSGIKFSSRQETTYLNDEVSYQEASLFSPGIEVGRIINAYTDKTNYVLGHKTDRLMPKNYLSNSLNLTQDELYAVSEDYLVSSLGDITRIENFVPINSFTLDEKSSTYTQDNGTYKITLVADKLSILNNVFARYNLGNSSLSSYVSLKLEDEFKMNINFEISDNYDLQKMSFEYNYEDISFSCTLDLNSVSAIENSANYETAKTKEITSFNNEEFVDNVKETASILESILLQFSNKSQFVIPLSFSITENDKELYSVEGNIELQTLWEYSDFKNLDTEDITTIYNFAISNVNFNAAFTVKNEEQQTSTFYSSYSSKTQSGQYSYTDFDNVRTLKNFTFEKVDSTHDLLENLFGSIKDDVQDKYDENKNNLKNYLTSLNAEHEKNLSKENINYIDSFFYDSLTSKIDFDFAKDDDFQKVTITNLEGFGTNLTSFLNGNDLNLLANIFLNQFEETKDYEINFDPSSLNFKVELVKDLDSKLLENFVTTINFKNAEENYSLKFQISKITEMDSISEFIENKYIFTE